jgi:hypothetical protein
MKKKTRPEFSESSIRRWQENKAERERKEKEYWKSRGIPIDGEDPRLLYVGWTAIGKLFGRVSARTMKRTARAYGWSFREVNGKPAVSQEELWRMIKRICKKKF